MPVLQAALIPISVALSILGLASSVHKLLGDLREQRHQSGVSGRGIVGMALPATASC